MKFIIFCLITFVMNSQCLEILHLENLGNLLRPVTCIKSNGSFSYQWDSPVGPDCWAATFPQCGGKFQSPININTYQVNRIHTNVQITCAKWIDKPARIDVKNTGKTIEIKFEYNDGKNPILKPGPISANLYQLDSAHIHFIGSEHSFNLFEKFSMEAHLVFFNLKYGTKENAMNFKDGLIVIGKFYKLQYGVDPDFTFIRQLEEVGSHLRLTDDRVFSLSDVFGSINFNFYAYSGSLTMPECNEVVTFMLDDKPLKISLRTLKILSHIRGDEGYMSPNIRPTQPTNGRKVYHYSKQL